MHRQMCFLRCRAEPTPELEVLGAQLDGTRRELMLGGAWGLTTTYNHVHDPDDHDAGHCESSGTSTRRSMRP